MVSKKILLSGPVRGNLTALYKRVTTVDKSNGPFDALFCVGQFFAGPDLSVLRSSGRGFLCYPDMADSTDDGPGFPIALCAQNMVVLFQIPTKLQKMTCRTSRGKRSSLFPRTSLVDMEQQPRRSCKHFQLQQIQLVCGICSRMQGTTCSALGCPMDQWACPTAFWALTGGRGVTADMHWLGRSGVVTIKGLSVAFLDGTHDPKQLRSKPDGGHANNRKAVGLPFAWEYMWPN